MRTLVGYVLAQRMDIGSSTLKSTTLNLLTGVNTVFVVVVVCMFICNCFVYLFKRYKKILCEVKAKGTENTSCVLNETNSQRFNVDV